MPAFVASAAALPAGPALGAGQHAASDLSEAMVNEAGRRARRRLISAQSASPPPEFKSPSDLESLSGRSTR